MEPPANRATEGAADATKALTGAADAANMWIALSLIGHTLDKEREGRYQHNQTANSFVTRLRGVRTWQAGGRTGLHVMSWGMT